MCMLTVKKCHQAHVECLGKQWKRVLWTNKSTFYKKDLGLLVPKLQKSLSEEEISVTASRSPYGKVCIPLGGI